MVAAVPVIAAAGLASTAFAAVPQQRGDTVVVSTLRHADRDDGDWCYFRVWYPCYDHDRYHDGDWFHHRHNDWDHDHDHHDFDRHDHDFDRH